MAKKGEKFGIPFGDRAKGRVLANPMTIDFTNVLDMEQHASGQKPYVETRTEVFARAKDGKSLSPKQIRARQRRKRVRGKPDGMTKEETQAFYRKPIEEWDMEELAHGKPRSSNGKFTGRKPTWVTAAVSEEMANRFRTVVKENMNVTTVSALKSLQDIIDNDDVDEKGKPIVPASVKLDATKFLLEHVVGKPTQRVEQDISVKLQGVLAQVMVNPAELATGNFMPAHYPGLTMPLSEGNYDDDNDLIPSSEG